jgi:hypothetical protein
MKKTLVLFACALLAGTFTSDVFAQNANEFRRFDINWNVLSYSRQASENGLGGTLAFTVHVNDRWGIVADTAIHSRFDTDVEMVTYRFGPKITHRWGSRGSAFAQFLAGGVHFSIPSLGAFSPTANGFSMLVGGGVDVGIRPWFAFRVVEGGYSGIRLCGGGAESRDCGWSNGSRVSTGIVFRFGH